MGREALGGGPQRPLEARGVRLCCLRRPLARVPEAVLEKTAPGQSPDQQIDFLVDLAAVGRERAERQTCAQMLRAIYRAGAELPQAD